MTLGQFVDRAAIQEAPGFKKIQSYSFGGGSAFRSFAIGSGRAIHVYRRVALEVGDVLQADWTGHGRPDHTVLVTLRIHSGGKIFFAITAHTHNRHNMPLSYFIQAGRAAEVEKRRQAGLNPYDFQVKLYGLHLIPADGQPNPNGDDHGCPGGIWTGTECAYPV